MINVTDYIIIIAAIFGFSMMSSVTLGKGFSMGIFLISMNISLCVLIWRGVLPFFMIIFCILLTVALLISDKFGSSAINE